VTKLPRPHFYSLREPCRAPCSCLPSSVGPVDHGVGVVTLEVANDAGCVSSLPHRHKGANSGVWTLGKSNVVDGNANEAMLGSQPLGNGRRHPDVELRASAGSLGQQARAPAGQRIEAARVSLVGRSTIRHLA